MAAHQPPAQPKAVLRGHQVQVHATAFVRGNQRLASGDADGYVVLWDLTTMRPTAVWRAHTNAILGIASWGTASIITHGRDNQLIVWKVTADDEATLSRVLPLGPSPSPRPQPWVLHILPVNTMNFCSFALCSAAAESTGSEFLIAVPNTLASESVDIYHFPSQTRLHTVHSGPKDEKNGMVMALALFYLGASLTLVTSYENGLVMLLQLDEDGSWATLYRAQGHSQPVLSLDVAPRRDYFLTSSADSLVVKHPIPLGAAPLPAPGPGRHAPATTLAGSAVVAKPDPAVSLLSAALASEPKPAKSPGKLPTVVETKPLKVVNTKHSGQQSLRIRPDGKIFATAGWDSKVRVYSAKTMQELAVLKWHQVGCYAAAFADPNLTSHSSPGSDDRGTMGEGEAGPDRKALVPRLGDLTVKDRRIQQANEAHWLAAGSKDGKISLWDIY